MSPYLILSFVFGYFILLWCIGYFTSRGTDNAGFFLGNRKSPWYIVAFGMIGASLSGVTFISLPGTVGVMSDGSYNGFFYMQMVLGYLPGYMVIAFVLLPLYYRLNLTSIYTYLNTRFGRLSYKSGAWFFLISRLIGSAFRLFLVAIILQIGVFDKLGVEVPFFVTVAGTIGLIWLYTYKGGIKTIIWTDTLQTTFMLLAVILTIYIISGKMGMGVGEMAGLVKEGQYSQMFFWENWNDPRHFFKQFVGGMFIAIVMTGLDQDMMQKNLSCKNIGEAQKNVISFSVVLVGVNLLFLTLGALLYIFASSNPDIPLTEKGDHLYATLAMDGHLGALVALLFIMGLIAAAYSSADSALTALTTSFCVDILETDKESEESAKKIRKKVHIGISVVMVLVILIFKAIDNDSVINQVFTVAGYTYGPLLGLYSYGLFTNRMVRDGWVPAICIASPIISFLLSYFSEGLFNGYQFGFELLLVNGLITFIGLWISGYFKKAVS